MGDLSECKFVSSLDARLTLRLSKLMQISFLMPHYISKMLCFCGKQPERERGDFPERK